MSKTIVGLSLLLCLLLTACSNLKKSDTQEYARIDVYDAATEILLTSIDTADTLASFNTSFSVNDIENFDDSVPLPQDAIAEYRFEVFKSPVAIINDGKDQHIFSVTTYINSSIVKFSDIAVPGLSGDISSWNQKCSDSTVAELRSLAIS